MKKITLQMIAERVGVSKALVSKALSHDPAVKDDTKETIWRTAEEMGYKVKSLRKQPAVRTGNIAVLMPRAYLSDFEYWGKILHGVDQELTNNGFSMLLSGIDIELHPAEGIPHSISEDKVDGALVLGHMPEPYVQILTGKRLPLVMVDSNHLDPAIDHVLANNFLGTYHAVRHLIAAGHRRIAFVGDHETAWSFRERKRGYAEAISDAGDRLPSPSSEFLIKGMGVSGNGNYVNPEFADNLRRALMAEEEAVTALMCSNDMIAFEALKVVADLGLRCPEDISVIGFDDLTLAEMLNPRLTTVKVPKESIGKRAVQVLFSRFAELDRDTEHVLISTELIERSSVKKL